MRSLLVLFVACARPAPAPVSPIEPPLFAVTDAAFGPVGAKTPATLAALRRAFAGYEVVPINHEALEYRVSKAGVKLFEIVPDEDGTILNIHVTTPRLVVGPYRVGAPFAGGATACECWSDQIVCFREGDHVAVALAKICREGTLASGAARKALVDVPIRATIWSPRPLVAGGAMP